MSEKTMFEDLVKLPKVEFAGFCKQSKIKVPEDAPVAVGASLVDGLQQLHDAKVMPTFFHVLVAALPARERVWFACLTGRDMLAEGVDKTKAIVAAEAWVFKPNLETREAVQEAILASEMDDPTLLVADAANHSIVAGLEDEVDSPPTAAPSLVFGLILQKLYAGDDAAEIDAEWNKLVARGLNIAAGGNGKVDA